MIILSPFWNGKANSPPPKTPGITISYTIKVTKVVVQS